MFVTCHLPSLLCSDFSYFVAVGNTKLRRLRVRLPSRSLLRSFLENASYEQISNIHFFRDGVKVNRVVANECFECHNFNCLHISAYYNHHHRCKDYLEMGLPLIRGTFGSPLTVALERHAVKCVDAILTYLIETLKVLRNDSLWPAFQHITNDIVSLLSCNSVQIVPFFKSLMQHSAQTPPLPQFIAPKGHFPMVIQQSSRFLLQADFEGVSESSSDDYLVKFFISLVRWNCTAGSKDSIQLLTAFAECRNRKVLLTNYVSLIVNEKWHLFFPFTFGITATYAVLLITLALINFQIGNSFVLCIAFLVLNGLFLLYEFFQMVSTGRSYWTDPWNHLDLVRATLAITWAVSNMRLEPDISKYLSLAVIVLCFLRGFTYFRSFKMTRIFVYMTMSVVKEAYSFLVIIAYSVFSFGMFNSALIDDRSVSASLTSAYNLIMGNFDNEHYNKVEWAVFIAASVTNVIVMLNLLISILGEAYEKSQMTMRENDLHQMLTLILEYEHMMFWRRESGEPTFIALCESTSQANEEEEWEGRILAITHAIRQDTTHIEAKMTAYDAANGNSFAEVKSVIEGEQRKTDRRLEDIENRISGMGAKIEGVETNIAAIQAKLEVILTLLSPQV